MARCDPRRLLSGVFGRSSKSFDHHYLDFPGNVPPMRPGGLTNYLSHWLSFLLFILAYTCQFSVPTPLSLSALPYADFSVAIHIRSFGLQSSPRAYRDCVNSALFMSLHIKAQLSFSRSKRVWPTSQFDLSLTPFGPRHY
jgi:hypothetical protein